MPARTPPIACLYCDLLQTEVPLLARHAACCSRCGATLFSARRGSVARTLAVALTAAMLLAIASAFPILDLEFQRQRHASTLNGAVHALWEQDARPLAEVLADAVRPLPPLP